MQSPPEALASERSSPRVLEDEPSPSTSSAEEVPAEEDSGAEPSRRPVQLLQLRGCIREECLKPPSRRMDLRLTLKRLASLSAAGQKEGRKSSPPLRTASFVRGQEEGDSAPHSAVELEFEFPLLKSGDGEKHAKRHSLKVLRRGQDAYLAEKCIGCVSSKKSCKIPFTKMPSVGAKEGQEEVPCDDSFRQRGMSWSPTKTAALCASGSLGAGPPPRRVHTSSGGTKSVYPSDGNKRAETEQPMASAEEETKCASVSFPTATSSSAFPTRLLQAASRVAARSTSALRNAVVASRKGFVSRGSDTARPVESQCSADCQRESEDEMQKKLTRRTEQEEQQSGHGDDASCSFSLTALETLLQTASSVLRTENASLRALKVRVVEREEKKWKHLLSSATQSMELKGRREVEAVSVANSQHFHFSRVESPLTEANKEPFDESCDSELENKEAMAKLKSLYRLLQEMRPPEEAVLMPFLPCRVDDLPGRHSTCSFTQKEEGHSQDAASATALLDLFFLILRSESTLERLSLDCSVIGCLAQVPDILLTPWSDSAVQKSQCRLLHRLLMHEESRKDQERRRLLLRLPRLCLLEVQSCEFSEEVREARPLKKRVCSSEPKTSSSCPSRGTSGDAVSSNYVSEDEAAPQTPASLLLHQWSQHLLLENKKSRSASFADNGAVEDQSGSCTALDCLDSSAAILSTQTETVEDSESSPLSAALDAFLNFVDIAPAFLSLELANAADVAALLRFVSNLSLQRGKGERKWNLLRGVQLWTASRADSALSCLPRPLQRQLINGRKHLRVGPEEPSLGERQRDEERCVSSALEMFGFGRRRISSLESADAASLAVILPGLSRLDVCNCTSLLAFLRCPDLLELRIHRGSPSVELVADVLRESKASLHALYVQRICGLRRVLLKVQQKYAFLIPSETEMETEADGTARRLSETAEEGACLSSAEECGGAVFPERPLRLEALKSYRGTADLLCVPGLSTPSLKHLALYDFRRISQRLSSAWKRQAEAILSPNKRRVRAAQALSACTTANASTLLQIQASVVAFLRDALPKLQVFQVDWLPGVCVDTSEADGGDFAPETGVSFSWPDVNNLEVLKIGSFPFPSCDACCKGPPSEQSGACGVSRLFCGRTDSSCSSFLLRALPEYGSAKALRVLCVNGSVSVEALLGLVSSDCEDGKSAALRFLFVDCLYAAPVEAGGREDTLRRKRLLRSRDIERLLASCPSLSVLAIRRPLFGLNPHVGLTHEQAPPLKSISFPSSFCLSLLLLRQVMEYLLRKEGFTRVEVAKRKDDAGTPRPTKRNVMHSTSSRQTQTFQKAASHCAGPQELTELETKKSNETSQETGTVGPTAGRQDASATDEKNHREAASATPADKKDEKDEKDKKDEEDERDEKDEKDKKDEEDERDEKDEKDKKDDAKPVKEESRLGGEVAEESRLDRRERVLSSLENEQTKNAEPRSASPPQYHSQTDEEKARPSCQKETSSHAALKNSDSEQSDCLVEKQKGTAVFIQEVEETEKQEPDAIHAEEDSLERTPDSSLLTNKFSSTGSLETLQRQTVDSEEPEMNAASEVKTKSTFEYEVSPGVLPDFNGNSKDPRPSAKSQYSESRQMHASSDGLHLAKAPPPAKGQREASRTKRDQTGSVPLTSASVKFGGGSIQPYANRAFRCTDTQMRALEAAVEALWEDQLYSSSPFRVLSPQRQTRDALSSLRPAQGEFHPRASAAVMELLNYWGQVFVREEVQ